MSKLALFRFEASFSIGAGHAIRSCVIADELVERGWSCKIITTQETYDFIPALSRFERVDPSNELSQKADLLVVDHYGLDHEYESKMREFARKIMVIDDLANRHHDCDVLLDQTYGRAVDDYKTLVPSHCEILTGIDYVLLRKEIRQMRDKALEKRRSTTKVERILVSLGGSDPQNYSLKALEMIVKSEFQGKIDLVLGFSSVNRQSLEKYALDHNLDATFHVNADMAQLMYDADLCIGAAGSSVWERLYLGLPQVLIQTADNQALIFDFMKDKGISFDLSEAVCINDFSLLINLILTMSLGQNFDFIINKVIENNCAEVMLRPITLRDVDLLFEWQNIPGLRKYFRNPEVPTYEEHVRWFKKALNSDDDYFVIQFSGTDLGFISVVLNSNNEYEISWYIIPEFQGRGLGTMALNEICKVFHKRPLIGEVDERNISSMKSFLKAGFVERRSGVYYAAD